jgi:multiple sugar transport system permease protein
MATSVQFVRINRPWRKRLQSVAWHVILALGALTMIVPFVWMISSSLKAEGDIFIYPPQWIPVPVHWENYSDLLNNMPFALFTFNSFKVSSLAAIGQLLSCSLAAYAFARLKFPGREIVFFILLAALMIPGEVTLIPVYLIMRYLGWLNTHLPLTVPYFFGGSFGTFLLRQFFLTIPTELEDAALIDGAGRFTIYWRIFLPLAKPALATLGLFIFMAQWNNLLAPVIYLNDQDKMTLTVGLAYTQGEFTTQWNLLMAGAVISILPILILYAFAQKYFVQGVVLSGLKG